MVAVTGVVAKSNAVPLATPVAVWSAPSLYTTVNGPVPIVEVQVNCPAPETQNGPLAVRLPCGVVSAKIPLTEIPLPVRSSLPETAAIQVSAAARL